MSRDYRAIQRVLVITFLFNVIATAAKLVVGVATGALSLIADGLDSLFDGISNVIGLLAVRISSQPPDEDHPYGHRKFETLAALFIAGALFLTAWELGRSAIDRLLTASHAEVHWWSIVALLFGAGIQTGTGLWELAAARRLNSEVLVADARHTLTSIGVSAAVLLGLVCVWLGYGWADPVVALLVAAVIAKIGVDTVRENIPALVDRAPIDAAVIGDVVGGVQGVVSFHRIRSRGPSDNVAVDLHIRVASNLPMQEANAIADEVRRRLLDLRGVGDVTVHMEAQRSAESAADLHAAVRLAAQELGITLHEFLVQMVDHQLVLHLHVGVDPNATLQAAHSLAEQFEHAIMQRQPQVTAIHTHIEPASADILPGAPVSSGLQNRVRLAVERAVDDIPLLSAPHAVSVRQVEGRLFVTVEVLADGELSLTEAHDLSTRLSDTIRSSIPNIGDVLVHVEPEGEPQ